MSPYPTERLQKTPALRGFSDAAEWSRTITGVSTHKALNHEGRTFLGQVGRC